MTARKSLLQMQREHMKQMLGKNIMGRIYISHQGINAQYSGLREDAVAYAQWVAQQPEFQAGPHTTLLPFLMEQVPVLANHDLRSEVHAGLAFC